MLSSLGAPINQTSLDELAIEQVFCQSIDRLKAEIITEYPMFLNKDYRLLSAELRRVKEKILASRSSLLTYLTRPFSAVSFGENGQLQAGTHKRFFYDVKERIGVFVMLRGEPKKFRHSATEGENLYNFGIAL